MLSASGPQAGLQIWGRREEQGVDPVKFITDSALEMQFTRNLKQKRTLVGLEQPLCFCFDICSILNSGSRALIWSIVLLLLIIIVITTY